MPVPTAPQWDVIESVNAEVVTYELEEVRTILLPCLRVTGFDWDEFGDAQVVHDVVIGPLGHEVSPMVGDGAKDARL